MPNWKIHLEIGKRLNNYLKYNDADYNEFLLGNILPDINNRFIVRNIKTRISHAITHFDNGDYHHHLAFLNKYSDRINEPIYFGYYVHLYTDYLFNHDFYSKVELRKLNSIKNNSLKIMKQHDFKIFNNNYLGNTINLNNIDETLNKIKISEIDICKDDLRNVFRYLNNTPYYKGDYEFYKNNELEELLNKIVNNIMDSINNKKWLIK